jgi:acyl-CoA dehydrogenase
VPFARDTGRFVALARGSAGDTVLHVPTGDAVLGLGRNLAGEPRDDLTFDNVSIMPSALAPAPHGIDDDWLLGMGALLRTAQMVGALEQVLEASVGYANERVQFGRPIGKFQAIQHQLAVLGGEVAASAAALGRASDAVSRHHPDRLLAIGAAKSRASEAAGVVAAIAHQVHGAIGFTREFSLQRLTRRLWSWRDEFGANAYWNERLGSALLDAHAMSLWPRLAAL